METLLLFQHCSNTTLYNDDGDCYRYLLDSLGVKSLTLIQKVAVANRCYNPRGFLSFFLFSPLSFFLSFFFLPPRQTSGHPEKAPVRRPSFHVHPRSPPVTPRSKGPSTGTNSSSTETIFGQHSLSLYLSLPPSHPLTSMFPLPNPLLLSFPPLPMPLLNISLLSVSFDLQSSVLLTGLTQVSRNSHIAIDL